MVGDDLDLLEDGQLVPDSESDDSDDEQKSRMYVVFFFYYDLLPMGASEQGNVIGLVSMYI